jgi:hypothetical protein
MNCAECVLTSVMIPCEACENSIVWENKEQWRINSKMLAARKDDNYGSKIDKKDGLDQLIDDFNKKITEQFKDILFKIDNINSELKEVLITD